jgi:hypothetical protein
MTDVHVVAGHCKLLLMMISTTMQQQQQQQQQLLQDSNFRAGSITQGINFVPDF